MSSPQGVSEPGFPSSGGILAPWGSKNICQLRRQDQPNSRSTQAPSCLQPCSFQSTKLAGARRWIRLSQELAMNLHVLPSPSLKEAPTKHSEAWLLKGSRLW